MISLLDLPSEILLRILALVGSKQLRGCAKGRLVCKRWSALVQATTFTFDALENNGIGPNKYGAFSIKFDRVKSVINVDVTEAESDSPLFVPVEGEWRTILNTERKTTPFRLHAYDLLRRLSCSISKKQATKFVLRLSLEELDFLRDHEIARSLTLSTLIRSLPRSLESITIDNGGEPALGISQKEHHLCSLFLDKRRFPILSTLILRLPNICNQIFHGNVTEYPPLETIVVNLSLAIRPTMSLTTCKSCHNGDLATSELTKQLEKAGLDALPFLPQLKTFQIVETDVVDSVLFYGGRQTRTGSSVTQIVHKGQISGRWRYKCNVLDWGYVEPEFPCNISWEEV